MQANRVSRLIGFRPKYSSSLSTAATRAFQSSVVVVVVFVDWGVVAGVVELRHWCSWVRNSESFGHVVQVLQVGAHESAPQLPVVEAEGLVQHCYVLFLHRQKLITTHIVVSAMCVVCRVSCRVRRVSCAVYGTWCIMK
jgi:hypothetical protein